MSHDELVEMKLFELLGDRPGEVGELAIQLRREIVKLAPGCSELLYNTHAVSNVFTYTGKLGQAFLHIATYSQHVNLGFNQGANLLDPDSLLQGTGKLIRHIRVDDVSLLKRDNVRALIESSIEVGKNMAEAAGGVQQQTFEMK